MTSTQARLELLPELRPFRKWGECGTEISTLLPFTGLIADRICLVRSMHTEAINHDPAVTMWLTGHQNPGRPSFGAWTTYGLGTLNQNLPGYVVMTELALPQGGSGNWSNGFLPATYQRS